MTANAGFASVNAGKGGAGDILDTDKLVKQLKNPDFETFSVGGVVQSGEATEDVTTTNVITAAENGKTFFLNATTGFVSTLPAPAAGLRFKFIVKLVPTSGNCTVVTAASANVIQGNLMVASTVVPAIGEDSINFVASTTDIGDYCEVISDGTSWFLQGFATTTAGMTVTAA